MMAMSLVAQTRLYRGFEANLGQYPANIRFVNRAVLGGAALTNEAILLASGLRVELLGATNTLRHLGGAAHNEANNVFQGANPARYRRNEKWFQTIATTGWLVGTNVEWAEREAGTTLVVRVSRADSNFQLAFRDTTTRLQKLPNTERVLIETNNGLQYTLSAQGAGLILLDSQTVGLRDLGRGQDVELLLDTSESIVEVQQPFGTDAHANTYYAGSTHQRDADCRALSGLFCARAYLAKRDRNGDLIYITYLGGALSQRVTAASLKEQRVLLIGSTNSPDFPTRNAVQARYGGPALSADARLVAQGDAFLALVDGPTRELESSTFYGSDAPEIAAPGVDIRGNRVAFGLRRGAEGAQTIITSIDLAANRFSPEFPLERDHRWLRFTGSESLAVGMLAAGTRPQGAEVHLHRIQSGVRYGTVALALPPQASGSATTGSFQAASDAGNNLWVVLSALRSGLPERATLHQVDTTAGILRWSKTLGVSGSEFAGLLVDAANRANVSFFDPYRTAPTTPDVFQAAACEGADRRVEVYAPGGLLVYASYGSFRDNGQSLNGSGVYRPQLAGQIACIANTASRRSSPVIAPGQIVTLTGGGFDASDITRVSVRIDGRPAPVIAGAPGLIAVQVPYELSDVLSPLRVETMVNSVPIGDFLTRLATSAPAFFETGAVDESTLEPVIAMLNQNGTVNSPANPAAIGEVVSVFATGMGGLDPMPLTGGRHPIPPEGPLAFTINRGFVGIAGSTGLSQSVEPLYQGSAPGLQTGVVQFNFRVPNLPHTGTIRLGYSPSSRPGTAERQGVFYVR
jgi:uncharacterized protein (TIGR03437 family)